MEEKFDAVIVGGGIAGSVAALMLAREGLEVVVVEKGSFAGSKNMTGGRLYSHSLEGIIPDFAAFAPVERRVVKERISLMTETASTMMEYTSDRLAHKGADSYVVLRGVFDRWLMEQAEAAGAMSVTGIRVDDFVYHDGRVAGISAGGEEMLADIVILADGANSLLVEKCGLRKTKISPHQIAVGAKEVIGLDEKTIDDRFGLNPGEGAAWLFAGYPSGGVAGGGFLYTNKDSISLGIVVTLSEFEKSEKSVHRLMEDFKNHPAIRPLIKGGKLLEYSGHMVPEGGYNMIPCLHSDGVLVVGDAAALVINTGYTVRGMDLAVSSAVYAAKAAIAAKKEGDFSSASLSRYRKSLDESFVIKDMKQASRFPHFMENTPRIFNKYPEMADEIMGNVFVVDGGTPESMLSKLMGPAKKVGLLTLIKDGIKGVRAL
jgi:electron transfer flavoprotein-quinone oxidoreductase